MNESEVFLFINAENYYTFFRRLLGNLEFNGRFL